jgi:endo-1,4-beta-xylanase
VGLAILLTASPTASAETPSLKDTFKDAFLVGAALNSAQFTEEDARGAALVKAQFDAITPENVLKWERVHPQPDSYSFELPDRYVSFGEKNHMFIVGHTLVWHNQVPAWVFQGENGNPTDRETLLKRMSDHIHTVVGRYQGRINGWDVVNEALEEDGTLRQTPWLKIIGEDYIAKAFQFAHEADPQAELYYDDYNLENDAKLKGAVELLRNFRPRVSPSRGRDSGHYHLDVPTDEQVDAAITAFGKLGLKVMVTELDACCLAFHMGADVALPLNCNPVESVRKGRAAFDAASAGAALCRAVRRVSEAPRHACARYFLWRDRRRFLVE